MIIDIDKLPREGLEVCKDFEFLSSDLVEESTVFLQPVHAELVVKRLGDEISIKGTLTTRVSFICSRCLSPFEFPIDSDFDLVYLPEELDVIKEQLESDDMARFFYYSNELDVSEIVLEQLNLLFPVKPLCAENCKGICPICGKLNRDGECECVPKESDPRLERLKHFIKR